jgi:hypothetical protein
MTARTIRTALAAVALLASIGTAVPATADDVTDVAIVVGTGTISPGLPTTGCAQQTNITFNGTAVNAGDHAGVYPIRFDGNSGTNCETLQSGAGSGVLSGGVSGSVRYLRTGSVVTLTGTGAVNGAPHHITTAHCEFYPTSANPVTSYALHCTVTLGAGA